MGEESNLHLDHRINWNIDNFHLCLGKRNSVLLQVEASERNHLKLIHISLVPASGHCFLFKTYLVICISLSKEVFIIQVLMLRAYTGASAFYQQNCPADHRARLTKWHYEQF